MSWFAEKHGKGDVDALFSSVNQWLARAARIPQTSIETVDAMVETMRQQAAIDERRDPNGMHYRIVHWKPVSKPAKATTAEFSSKFQITKTYCLHGCLAVARGKRVLWKNYRFTDLQNGDTVQVNTSETVIDNRTWRRGAYTNPRWKSTREFPERGKQNTLMDRQEVLNVEMPEQADSLEKRLGKYERSLQSKRQRTQRQRRVLKELEASSSDSDSSTSSSSS